MGLFQIIITSLSLIFGWIFHVELLNPLQKTPWAFWLGIAFFATGFLTILARAFLDDVDRIESGMFFFMGFFSFLLVGIFFKELFWIGLWTFKRDPSLAHGTSSVIGVFVLATILYFTAHHKAHAGPVVETRLIPTPKNFSPGFKLRIVQISDLHIGSQIGPKYISTVVQLTNSQNPDVIVLTGDIGDGEPEKYISKASDLKKLQAKYGIFYVNGNHEYYRGVKEWAEAFRSFGFVTLENQSALLSVENTPVAFVGTTDYQPNLKQALEGLTDDAYKILLAHRPDIADQASEAGMHLQLSGHTHRGQFIPWSWMIRLFHKYTYGLYRIGNMYLYVNSGTGFWGPALRVGSQSEISVMEIRSEQTLPCTN